MKTLLSLYAILLAASLTTHAQTSSPFELRDGDRVVLVGDTLIEREPVFGAIEQRLTTQFPERNVIFRNLGWSADTPTGISRASFDFDKPGKGFELLTNQIAQVKPTVVILGYGMANSFDGEAGVSEFKNQMRRLMDAIVSLDKSRPPRFILLSPIRHEKLPKPLPDPTAHNQQLALYVQAVRELAAERSTPFVSLYDLKGNAPLTENGIHLNAAGYEAAADAITQTLGWNDNFSAQQVTIKNKNSEILKGAKLFDAHPTLQVSGLSSGNYELHVDGMPVQTASASEWNRGVLLNSGTIHDQSENLREAIARKNRLFFDRWRPQNETYLFGFRKYEQGQNAKEIPMFDPLIAAEETKIAALRKPASHQLELVRVTRSEKKPVVTPPSPPEEAPFTATPQPLPEFDVAPGFEVSLFAETPLLAKPIQMNFDSDGRLWVASSKIYPQIIPGQPANDTILVLEDTNHDGKAETSHVFADGLLIPSGVVPGDGGVYVGQSTELLFFRDTNGDGKADERRTVLSAFGTEDTHHMVHTLHWGFDGRLYFDQSIYIHTHIETPTGVRRLNSGGVWQFRTASQNLGVLLRGFCNPWGHQFDDFGQSFVTDGAGSQGINFGVPGATYFTYADMRRELKSISPGSYPKYCGIEIIRSPHFPADWQGNAITCDFRAHRVVRFSITDQGSAFAAKELPELLRSTNASFRPIDVKLGPDGALYIADWSNPIINHGEVDFRDPRRDHEHGRIWRITAKDRPLAPIVQLTKASNRALLDELMSPNRFNQQQARRVLTERGEKIRNDLAKWTRSHNNDEARMQALWMYQSLDIVEPKLLNQTLAATDGRIRAAAVRVAGDWLPRLKAPLDLLAPLARDQHPRVRLEAVRALAKIPQARSADLVLNVLDQPMDDVLDYGVWLSINDLADSWIAAVKSGAWKTEGHEKQLEFALKALPAARAGEVLSVVLAKQSIPRDGSGPWIELISTSGSNENLKRLFDQAVAGGFDAVATVRALRALTDAAKTRDAKPAGDLASLSSLFDNSNDEVREQSLRLAGQWKLKQFQAHLLKIASDASAKDLLRQAAFDGLRELGGAELVGNLQPLTSKEHPPVIRRQALLALIALDANAASKPAIDLLFDTTEEKPLLELWRGLLGVKGAAAGITAALPKTGVPELVAKTGLRVAREGGRTNPDLAIALSHGAGLQSTEELSGAEIRELAKTALASGDPARGEQVFRRKELSCVVCHSIGGVGGKVGPDLTSIGASSPADYLVESLFYPNRKVKEGFHAIMIETKDGLEFSGTLASENTDELVLRDATGKETRIAKSNIEKRNTGGSLMPNGLVDPLTPTERLDLIRFLSELGKPGAFDAAKGGVARLWHVRPANGDAPTDLTTTNGLPARTLVDGRLLKDEITESAAGTSGALLAVAQFQAAKNGSVRLKLTGVSKAWLDGKEVAPNVEIVTDLTAGAHALTAQLESDKLPEFIRLESADVTFLTN